MNGKERVCETKNKRDMSIVFLLIGLAVGFAIAFFWGQNQKKSVESELLLARQQASAEVLAKDEARKLLEQSQQQTEELRRQLTAEKMSTSSCKAQLEAERRQHDDEAKLRKEQFDAQLNTVKEQFQNLATKVLDQTSDKLKSTNSEAMRTLTAPLNDNLNKLHDAISKTNQETAKSTASLSEQLRAMAEQTEKMDITATRLTNVMRGGNKIQGNWGELILTEILEQNGFREGVNYDVQQTLTDAQGNVLMNDESGRRMIPDVVLHYPKNEDVIVDSKMSIGAYYEYVNCENDALKKKYADDLVKSVRTQFTNLAKKDYSSYVKPPRHAIDFVIMFVPHEGALQLAMATDKKLWNDAFERKVFITSQQNLMAILKMIEIAWRQYTQTENQQRVYGLAEELLKRVGEFIKRFDKVKKDIDSLSKDYDEAYNKAYAGRQSIVQKANELKTLGVKEAANQPIPEAQFGIEEE